MPAALPRARPQKRPQDRGVRAPSWKTYGPLDWPAGTPAFGAARPSVGSGRLSLRRRDRARNQALRRCVLWPRQPPGTTIATSVASGDAQGRNAMRRLAAAAAVAV